MRVSVIIPNWNGAKHLPECLDAVQAQSTKPSEIIVVDNGSTDNSVDLLNQDYPKVKLVKLSKNQGFAGGVNAGIRSAQGDYIVLLNNDAVAPKDWLKHLTKAMDIADIAASKILYYSDRTKVDTTGDFISKWGLSYPRGRDQKDTEVLEGYPSIFSACGGACIIKKEVIDDVGLFDEAFFAYYEDTDFGFRAQLRGYSTVLATQAEVYHHVGATSSTLGHFARFHSLKNTHYLFWKNMPSPLIWKVLPRFIFVEILLFGAALKNRALTTALSAYWEALLHIPYIWKQRRRIQRTKKVTSRDIEALLTDHWPLRTRLVSPFARKL